MKNEIKVIGEATLSVPPNIATITVGVVTENETLSIAQSENAATMTKVIESLIQIGIRENDMQTSQYTIFPQYDFVDGIQQFRNFRVQHNLSITTDQLEKIGTIIDTSVQNGANIIDHITFSTTNMTVIYNELLIHAIQDAYQKGNTIANAIGVTSPITPVNIIETTTNSQGVTHELFMVKQATPIQQGELTVTAQVIVHFTYKW